MAGKILKLWFIFLFVVLWSAAGWAVKDRPKYFGDQKSMEWLLKRRVDATYNTDLGPWSAGVFKSPFMQPAPTASPFFDTVGLTRYETDSNDRLQRQINRSSLGYIHAAYTQALNPSMTPRNFYYSAWVNTGVKSASEIQVSDVNEEGRGGFGGVTSLPDGRAVVFYHRSFGNLQPPEDNYVLRGSYFDIEAAPGAGTFTNNEYHAPDSVGPQGPGTNGKNGLLKDSGIWPDAAAQKYGDTNFVHVVWHEGDIGHIDRRYMGYVRAKEALAPNFFLWGKPYIFDTSRAFISASVVASQQSAKVALVYIHPRKGYPSANGTDNPDSFATDADLYYIESTTGGDDWQNGFQNSGRDTFVNITKYTNSDANRAWGDFSAAYDEQDSLVVAFTAPLFIPGEGVSGTQGSIYFWRRGIGGGGSDLREVYNYSIASDDDRRLQSDLPVANPQIGVYKGTAPDSIGDYYIIWTMGKGDDTTENDPPPLEGYWNYDIYCSATTNNGFSWSAITNITNSQTPACIVGVCDNDQSASLARDINDTLHIRYRNDKVSSAGPTNTVNDTSRIAPVYYLKVKAKPVGKDTLAALTPNLLSGFKFNDGSSNDTAVLLANAGNQPLTVNSITADNPNASVTVTPYGAPPFIIAEGGAPAKVFLNFNGAGPNTPCSSYTVRWTFSTNAENSNLGLSAGTFQVKAQFALQSTSEPFVPIRFLSDLAQTVQTTTGMRMDISNVGSVVGSISGRTGMSLPQGTPPNDSGIHFLSRGGALFGAMMSTGDTLVARYIPGEDETEYRALNIPGATSPPETIQVKDTTYSGDLPYDSAIAQGRPGKGGSWKIVRYNYAIDLFNDPQNFPDLDSTPPWPGHWFGYRFQDEFWFKNGATYNWAVWYRKKFQTAAPCWWPEWPGAPTFTSQIYDGIAMDWDPSSDSQSLGTTGIIYVNSTDYNDTFKFVYARGRGVPHNTRYAAQVFLVDTTMHFKGDTVCVFDAGILKCNVDPCSLSQTAHSKQMFGAKALSFESFIDPYGGFRTKELWELLTTPGWNLPDTTAFKQNKQDLILVSTHACCDPSEDTVAYAVGLAVTYKGIDSLKKSINEMRVCVGLDSIKATSCLFKPGDVNGNGSINLTDIVGLVSIVFKGAAQPVPKCKGDFNNTNTLNLTDIVGLVAFVFKNGADPAPSGVCCIPT